MSLSGSHAIGDTGHTADHNTIDTTLNTHTSQIAALNASSSTGVPTVYNVKDATYGALGNGVADDSAAIQAAIDAAYAAGGGQVYLPPGTYIVGQSASAVTSCCLLVRQQVRLVGAGRSTIVKAKAALPVGVTSVIKNVDGAWGYDVMSFTLDGNKANQTNTSNGITLSNTVNPLGPLQPGGIGNGEVTLITDMYVIQTKGDGFNLGPSEVRVSDCFAFATDGWGYNLNNDGYVVNCTAGVCGKSGSSAGGFQLNSDLRLTNCKAYGGAGSLGQFHVQSVECTLVACEVQESTSNGFAIGGSRTAMIGCKVSAQAQSAVWIKPGITDCQIEFTLVSPVTLPSGTYTTQYGVYFDTSTARNRVRVSWPGGTSFSSAAFGGTLTGQMIEVDSEKGCQSIAYAASITPSVYSGGTAIVGSLTGALTVNAPNDGHTGSTLTFILPQDATGGRVVTFNGVYKTSAAIPTTASSTTTVTFFCYDGTNWREVSRSTT